MRPSYETNCPKCEIKLKITERPLGGTGVTEKEKAMCPKCGEFIDEWATDGYLDVRIIEEKSH